jgi:hypothetical protein
MYLRANVSAGKFLPGKSPPGKCLPGKCLPGKCLPGKLFSMYLVEVIAITDFFQELQRIVFQKKSKICGHSDKSYTHKLISIVAL